MRRRIMQFGSDEHDVGYIARMQVRQWLMARTDPFRFEVAPLLVGLHALAARVDVEAFDVAIRKGISGEQTLPTILELIAEIADTLCRGLTGIEEDIVHKSLQETLFHCIGLELDLSVTECGKNFQTFLDQRGSRGFIRLFLGLHLFNVIWIERQDAIQASARNEQVLHQLMNEIERVSRVTVNAAMVSWKKWPELSVEFADSLLDAMNVRMREAVGAYSGAA